MHEFDSDAINAETKPELGYEYRDANWASVWKVYKWYVSFATIMVIVSVFIQWWMTHTKPGVPFRETHRLTRPKDPNPVIQSGDEAKLDIMNMRRDAKKKLDNYGYDQDTDQSYMPLDRAMEITAENGINPAPQETPKK